VERYEIDLTLDFQDESLTGLARLTIRNATRRPVAEVPLLLYRLLTVTEVSAPGARHVPFDQRIVAFEDEPRRQVNAVHIRLARPLPPGGAATFAVAYAGYLAGYVETGELYVRDRIDPAFTILRPDAYAYPVADVPSRRANRQAGLPEFDYLARVTVPESLVVANGGELVERVARGGQATWVYRNQRPAWRMDFAIAPYRVLEGRQGKVFYFPQDSSGAHLVRDAVARSMDLYTSWFGPRLDSNQFQVIEIPDGWGSQKDVTSILQSAAAFRDPRRIYEVYHEVSHIWNVRAREPFSPRIEEGLATYLEDAAAESLDGGSRLPRSNEAILAWLRDLLNQKPEYRTWAMKDYGRHEATDLSYSVGFLMFEVLHDLVGDAAFRQIVGGYYRRFYATGGTTAEFEAHAKSVSPVDLNRFFDDWLETPGWSRYVMGGDSVATLVSHYR
jgi:aminopeptidase N